MRRPSTSHGRRNTRSRSGRPFKLSHIEGLVLHLDPIASKVTLNGSDVSAVEDSSPSGFNATQSTAADQPAYTSSNANVNGNPTVDHVAASGEWLDLGDNGDAGTNSLHIFMVVYGTNTGSPQRLLDKRGTGGAITSGEPGYRFMYNGETAGGDTKLTQVVADSTNGGLAEGSVSGVSITDGSPHLFELYYDASAGVLRAILDGATAAEVTGLNLGSLDNPHHLVVGAYWDDASTQGQFLDNSWAEIVMYQPSVVLPASSLTDIRTKLADRHGVTLP